MTDSNKDTDPRARNLAEAAARLVRDGVADTQTAFDHVTAQERGRQIAARLNAQRTTPAPQQQQEKPK